MTDINTVAADMRLHNFSVRRIGDMWVRLLRENATDYSVTIERIKGDDVTEQTAREWITALGAPKDTYLEYQGDMETWFARWEEALSG